jgi:hypothetical protein
MCDVPCILVYDCSNYTNYFFITYTRLHVLTLLGHHQGAIDYQRLQNKMWQSIEGHTLLNTNHAIQDNNLMSTARHEGTYGGRFIVALILDFGTR